MTSKSEFYIRSIVSIILLLSFIISAFTGIVLIFKPKGPARIAGTFEKGMVSDLHTYSSIVMLSASIIHIYLNWNPLKLYFRKLLQL